MIETILPILAYISGILGVMIVLAPYTLMQMNIIKGRSVLYTGLNVLGTLMLMFSLMYYWNMASFILECVWLVISTTSMVLCIKRKEWL